MTLTTRKRGRRTDSIRNEEKVRAAAEVTFARLGDSLSMDNVAAEAGVSKGTVYVTFPTREQLVEEMTVLTFGRSLQAMHAAARSEDPWQGLLDAVLSETLGVAFRAEISDDTSPLTPSRVACLKSEQALDDLLELLRQRGVVRPGITARQVSLLFRGLYLALPPYAERSSSETRLYAQIILRGIRTE